MKIYTAYEIWRLIQNKTINSSDEELRDDEEFVKLSQITFLVKEK